MPDKALRALPCACRKIARAKTLRAKKNIKKPVPGTTSRGRVFVWAQYTGSRKAPGGARMVLPKYAGCLDRAGLSALRGQGIDSASLAGMGKGYAIPRGQWTACVQCPARTVACDFTDFRNLSRMFSFPTEPGGALSIGRFFAAGRTRRDVLRRGKAFRWELVHCAFEGRPARNV